MDCVLFNCCGILAGVPRPKTDCVLVGWLVKCSNIRHRRGIPSVELQVQWRKVLEGRPHRNAESKLGKQNCSTERLSLLNGDDGGGCHALAEYICESPTCLWLLTELALGGTGDTHTSWAVLRFNSLHRILGIGCLRFLLHCSEIDVTIDSPFSSRCVWDPSTECRLLMDNKAV